MRVWITVLVMLALACSQGLSEAEVVKLLDQQATAIAQSASESEPTVETLTVPLTVTPQPDPTLMPTAVPVIAPTHSPTVLPTPITPASTQIPTLTPIPSPTNIPLHTPTPGPTLTTTPTPTPSAAERDRETLIAIYNATGGHWQFERNWLTSAPISEWFGVQVDDAGRVVRLDLTNRDMFSQIPPQFGELDELRHLNLDHNGLVGEIPPELGNLKNLRYLSLYNNELNGTIPPELGKLSNLVYLSLESNKFSGRIPTELGELPNLNTFLIEEIGYTKLTGCIPAKLRDVPVNDLDSLGLPFCSVAVSPPTVTATALAVLINVPQPTPTFTMIPTPTPTPTFTVIPTSTPMPIETSTAIVEPTPTPTLVSTVLPTPTISPTLAPTPMPKLAQNLDALFQYGITYGAYLLHNFDYASVGRSGDKAVVEISFTIQNNTDLREPASASVYIGLGGEEPQLVHIFTGIPFGGSRFHSYTVEVAPHGGLGLLSADVSIRDDDLDIEFVSYPFSIVVAIPTPTPIAVAVPVSTPPPTFVANPGPTPTSVSHQTFDLSKPVRIPRQGDMSTEEYDKLLDELVEENLAARPHYDEREIEQRVFALANGKRARYVNTDAAIHWDEAIAQVARDHSRHMADNDHFGHVDLQGRLPEDRERDAGISCYRETERYTIGSMGENLFFTEIWDTSETVRHATIYKWQTMSDIANEAVDGWMTSPDHRDNMLHPAYIKMGVGVAIAQNGGVYITQNFC